MSEQSAPNKLGKVDIAIITVLPDECEAVLERFKPYAPYHHPHGRTYWICNLQTKDGHDCKVAIVRTSDQGNDISQKLATDIIADIKPGLILIVGIGGGVPDEEFTLGDVIVSSRIYNFNVGAHHEDDSISHDIRADIHPLVSKIVGDLPFYKNQLGDWNSQESIGKERPSLDLLHLKISGDNAWRDKVLRSVQSQFGLELERTRLPLFTIGAVASSNHLMRSPAELKRWHYTARKIVAVEMEAAGVFVAAQGIRRQYPVMAIRGISDIIGLERDKRWKEYACHSAAAFAYAFIVTVPIHPQRRSRFEQARSVTDSNYSRRKNRTAKDLTRRYNWSEAPEVDVFFGRANELTLLEKWILEDQCRLVAIVGMKGIGKTKLSVKLGKGGIGKTDLSIKLARGIQDRFEYVIWQRLLNAPRITDVLANLIRFLSEQTEIDLPDSVDGQISRLLFYLREHRCLLVFDNAETLLEGGKHVGQYREGYEEYGQLFRQVAEVQHQSCLLLTSREKPQDIALLEGKTRPVRSLELGGLDYENSKNIFAAVGEFQGSEKDWQELTEFYSGNPLALELAAKHIQDVFSSSIVTFLREGKQIFSDLHDLLNWYFDRLAGFEKEVMYWLAINREPTSHAELKEDILSPIARERIPSTLQRLQRLVPVERSGDRFTLQPVLIEYMTEQFIKQILSEVEHGNINLLNTYALLKALTKDYVRESQIRLILLPIIQSLLTTYGKAACEQKLKRLLADLRETQSVQPGYAAGNILNCLIQSNADLCGTNFSYLTVWQAYLREASLIDVNFSHADLSKSVFTDIFGSILSVAFAPDGATLAAGTDTGEVRVWRMSDGTPLFTLSGHSDWIWGLAFSPNGTRLASGSSDQTIRLWDVESEHCLHVLRGHTHRIRCVTFSPDGTHLASASEDHTIRIWDVESGQFLYALTGHTNPVRAITFSPDGKRLVSGSDDHTVRIWDIPSERCTNVLQGLSSQIWSLALSHDGKIIASGSDDRTVRTWDMMTGECLNILQGHTSWICSLAFTPDGRTLASGSADGTARLWNASTGQPMNTLSGHKNWINSVSFSPDGQTLATGSHDQTVRLWETNTGRSLMTLQGYSNWVRSVAFHPHNNLLASGDRSVRLWNTMSGEKVATLQGHTTWIRTITFSSDGAFIASGSDDQTARIWKVHRAQLLHVLSGHTNRVKSIAFNPEGTLLVSGSDDHTVRLWDIQGGHRHKILRGHTNRIRSVAFSPIGTMFASGSDDRTARIWDIQSDQAVYTLKGHTNRIWSIAFSPDGQFLATGSEDTTIRLWDVITGQCLHILQGHTNPVWAIAFNPDGTQIVSSSEDRSVRLWEVSTGQCQHVLLGHTNTIWALAFSPNSKLIASGSHDNTIRLWDTLSGENLAILRGHKDPVWALAFSPNTQSLASSSDDGTCRLWDVQDVRQAVCRYILKSELPYEHMNIFEVTGLTAPQKAILRALGAIEDEIEMIS